MLTSERDKWRLLVDASHGEYLWCGTNSLLTELIIGRVGRNSSKLEAQERGQIEEVNAGTSGSRDNLQSKGVGPCGWIQPGSAKNREDVVKYRPSYQVSAMYASTNVHDLTSPSE